MSFAELQAQATISRGVHVALEQLAAQGETPKGVGVAVGALAAAGVDSVALLDTLHNDIGYPYNTILPGMLKANMLEFHVDLTEEGRVRLRLMHDWKQALLALGFDCDADSASACPAARVDRSSGPCNTALSGPVLA